MSSALQANMMPRANWIPRTRYPGVIFASRPGIPVAAAASQSTPSPSPDAATVEASQRWAMAATEITFFGSTGMGRR